MSGINVKESEGAMTVLIVCISVSVFILIVAIFYKPAKIADNQGKRLKQIKKSYEVQLDDVLEKPFIQRIIIPFFNAMVKKVSSLLPQKKENNSDQKLAKKLKLAGMGESGLFLMDKDLAARVYVQAAPLATP